MLTLANLKILCFSYKPLTNSVCSFFLSLSRRICSVQNQHWLNWMGFRFEFELLLKVRDIEAFRNKVFTEVCRFIQSESVKTFTVIFFSSQFFRNSFASIVRLDSTNSGKSFPCFIFVFLYLSLVGWEFTTWACSIAKMLIYLTCLQVKTCKNDNNDEIPFHFPWKLIANCLANLLFLLKLLTLTFNQLFTIFLRL